MINKNIILIIVFLILSSLSFADISDKDREIYLKKYDYSKYPNGSAAVLYDYTNIKINKDNTKEYLNRKIQKILSYKGKKERAEYKIYYDGRFENVEIIRASTINNNNGILNEIAVSKNEIKELDDPDEAGFMDYMSSKMKVIVFPAVEDGSIIDLEYKIIAKDNYKRSYSSAFATTEPVLYKNFSITFDENENINIYCENAKSGIKRSESINNGLKTVTFEKENLEQIVAEEGAAPVYMYAPMIYVSMYKNFDEIKDVLLRKFDNKLEPSLEIKKSAIAITTKYGDDKDKVEALKNYVAKTIMDIPVKDFLTREVRSPDETVKKGYGASFDRVALFVTLARAAGFEAYPVVSGIDGNYLKYEKTFLDMENFGYLFAAVKINGELYYVETSSEFYNIGEVPANNEYIISLVPGKFKFDLIDPQGDKRAGITEIYNINLDINGDAEIEKLTVYYGQMAANIRGKYRYMTPYQRRVDFESMLASISQSSEPISKEPDVLLGNVASVRYRYKVKNFAQVDGNFLYFDMPITITPMMLRTEPEDRKYPFQMLENTIVIRKVNIVYTGKYSIGILPEFKKVKTDVFIVDRKTSEKKGIIHFEDKIEFVPNIAGLKEYKEIFNKLINLSSVENNRVLIIKK